MPKKFSSAEWEKIHSTLDDKGVGDFFLPESRAGSVVIGTFNIRKLGKKSLRSVQAWEFLKKVCSRFDLIAIQEVMDDLQGINHLKSLLGEKYGMVVTDVTGVFPGDRGNPERLSFLFRWDRISRTELASDISYDKSKIVNTLFENRLGFNEAWDSFIDRMKKWDEDSNMAAQSGKRKPSKPGIVLPVFLTFIRQPQCASFEIISPSGNDPLGFLAVNAHLLYGYDKDERFYEFIALLEWISERAKYKKNLYHKNLLLLGDCNLEFRSRESMRKEVDKKIKSLNSEIFRSRNSATVNFPLLTPNPIQGELMTNARKKETYDQIGIFSHDKRFPTPAANKKAGKNDPDSYNYGVFDFAELISRALFNRKFSELSKKEKEYLHDRCAWDISDHMPAWMRIKVP